MSRPLLEQGRFLDPEAPCLDARREIAVDGEWGFLPRGLTSFGRFRASAGEPRSATSLSAQRPDAFLLVSGIAR